MSAERFHIVDVNPNEASGGGGCLCGETRVEGCEGPYAVFDVTDMDSILSPRPVIGAKCLRAACAALDGETLSGGEPGVQIDHEEADTEETEVIDDPRTEREFVPEL